MPTHRSPISRTKTSPQSVAEVLRLVATVPQPGSDGQVPWLIERPSVWLQRRSPAPHRGQSELLLIRRHRKTPNPKNLSTPVEQALSWNAAHIRQIRRHPHRHTYRSTVSLIQHEARSPE